MGVLAAELLASDNALCVLYGNAALCFVHEDDEADHDDEHQEHTERYPEVLGRFHLDEGDQGAHIGGEACEDTGEQDHGDAVADALVADLVTHPDNEGSTCCEACDDDDGGEPALGTGRVLDSVHGVAHGQVVSDGHEDRQSQRHACADLVDLLASLLAFLLQPFKRREGIGEKLDDDGCVDIRGDGQGKYRSLRESTAGQDIQVLQEVTACRVFSDPLIDGRQIQKRNRDSRSDAENQNNEKRVQELLPEIRDAPGRFQCLKHCQITSAFPPAFSIFSAAACVNFAAFTVS